MNSVQSHIRFILNQTNIQIQGQIQDLHLVGGGGGGHNRLCAPMHITSANHKVPYGKGPGPTKEPWKLSGFLMLSRAI